MDLKCVIRIMTSHVNVTNESDGYWVGRYCQTCVPGYTGNDCKSVIHHLMFCRFK